LVSRSLGVIPALETDKGWFHREPEKHAEKKKRELRTLPGMGKRQRRLNYGGGKKRGQPKKGTGDLRPSLSYFNTGGI